MAGVYDALSLVTAPQVGNKSRVSPIYRGEGGKHLTFSQVGPNDITTIRFDFPCAPVGMRRWRRGHDDSAATGTATHDGHGECDT